MKSNTTTTTPGKVAKGRKPAPRKVAPPHRLLPWSRAELAAEVEGLTGKAYGHDYLSEVARGVRKNADLLEAINKAAKILDARHKVSN